MYLFSNKCSYPALGTRDNAGDILITNHEWWNIGKPVGRKIVE